MAAGGLPISITAGWMVPVLLVDGMLSHMGIMMHLQMPVSLRSSNPAGMGTYSEVTDKILWTSKYF